MTHYYPLRALTTILLALTASLCTFFGCSSACLCTLMIHFSAYICTIITNFCTEFIKVFCANPSCRQTTNKHANFSTCSTTRLMVRTFFGIFTLITTSLSCFDGVKASIYTLFIHCFFLPYQFLFYFIYKILIFNKYFLRRETYVS